MDDGDAGQWEGRGGICFGACWHRCLGGHVTPSNPQEYLPGPSNSLSNSHFFPQAMNRMDMVCVPLYDTLGEPAVQYIIKHAETRFVLSSGAKLALLARAVAKAKDVVSCGIAYWGEAPEETIKV